jgi:hypothetical protein
VKEQLSEEAQDAARELAREALEARLAEIEMSDVENDAFEAVLAAVSKEIVQLRLVRGVGHFSKLQLHAKNTHHAGCRCWRQPSPSSRSESGRSFN